MTDKDTAKDKPENDNEPTGIDETKLYDAISGAIDEVSIKPKNENDDDTDGTDDESGADADESVDDDAAAGDTTGADDEGDEEESETEGETDEKAGADDAEDGGDKSGDDASKEADPAGDESSESDDTPPELDPVNDPIPESTNAKTAERIKSLIEIVKGKNESESQRDEILEQITNTGTDADQYANTLGFLKLYNSQDPAERKQALTVARGLVKELALDLGEGTSVTNLADHEDLQAEVEAGTLTEVRANEIAATRERQTLQDNRATVANDKATTESTTQANVTEGRSQLDALETAIRGADENYAAIRPTFIKLLGPVLKRTHPTEWGEAAREVYDQVKTLAPATATPKAKPKNTPMRPKQGAGGGTDKKTGADTALGAIDDALANM